VEVMFNLGDDGPQRLINGSLVSEPSVQLWGQTISPFTFTSVGKHAMLGVRFFAHTAACFFDEPVATFNDLMMNFNDVTGPAGRQLYANLRETRSLAQQIALLENFLLVRLTHRAPKLAKQQLMQSIVQDMNRPDFLENINTVAARYGLSSRYLQKIFIAYSGLSPALFFKIMRFQKGLQEVSERRLPLTTIAYRCGYYDQSHFIKDFKQFTGVSPSHFRPESSTDLFAQLNN